jgi:3-isopropylmalate/(R)-2-methylmalate dehydratase small subunit
MEAFTKLTAIAAPYAPINVDTDQISPARFLKYPRSGGYGQFLFHDVRRTKEGGERADFVLNQSAYRNAKIFVGNTNFACGSSREGAVYALADVGFRSVIAPSFGDIFYNNCQKNGVVPVRLDAAVCDKLRAMLEAKPGTTLTVDLERQVVVEPDGTTHPFTLDAFGREMILKGVDELGLTLSLKGEIESFERQYARHAPWIVGH